MAEPVTNELMYEILKSIQAQVAITREDMEDLKTRFSSAERHLASVDTRLAMLHTDLANQAMRLDRIDSRLGRVETRLNFGEQAN